MARKHEVAIASETGAFEKGIKSGVVQPLEQAEDALDKLGRNKSPDKLQDAIEGAQKETAELRSEIKKTADAIDSEFRGGYARMKTSSADASDAARKNLHEVSDNAREVGDELRQNLGETFSSFRGDLEDLPQIAQDTLGGLAGSGALGGIPGLIATAAGAAGLGLLIGAFEKGGQKSEELKAKAAELAAAYIEASGRAAPAVEDIADALKELATASDDSEANLAKLRDVADRSGNSFEDLAQAYAGNTEALDDLVKSGKEHKKQLEDELEALDPTIDGYAAKYKNLTDLNVAQDQYNAYLAEAKDAADEATQAEQNWIDAGGEAMQIKADLVEGVASAYDSVRSSAIDAATSEEGVFDVSKWAEYVAAQKGQVEQYQANLAQLKLSPAQWTNLMELPEESRMAIVQSLVSGPEEAKGKIVDALTDAGSSAAAGAQVSFNESFNPDADVTVTADTSKAKAELEAVAKRRDAEIAVKTTGKAEARGDLDELAKTRDVTLRVRVDTSAWDRWQPPAKTATVRGRIQYSDG